MSEPTPTIDDVDFTTLALFAFDCSSCKTGQATWIVHIQCTHGYWMFVARCTPCWDREKKLYTLKSGDTIMFTLKTSDYTHSCPATTWTARPFTRLVHTTPTTPKAD